MLTLDFTQRIAELVGAYEHGQTQLAAEWLERWNALPGKRDLSSNTVPSRLSELCKGKPNGVGFFFKDRQRAQILFDILDVPSDDREALTSSAEALVDGSVPARLCVLLSLEPRPSDPEFWTHLRRWLEDPTTPRPMLLSVNDDQWDQVPRSLDDVAGLTIEKQDPDAATAAAKSVVDQGGLVATSRWGIAPYAQWIATDFEADDEGLACAPAGWRATWKADAQLAGLPTPKQRLDALDHDMADSCGEQLVGVALHAQLNDLVAGTLPQRPEQRLALASALGVVAGASDDEVDACTHRREEAQLVEAAGGREVQLLDDGGLKGLLARSRVQRTEAICKVGEDWHWINVAPPAEFAEHARVTHHEIDAPEPALTRLWEAVKGWTEADLARDPMLQAAARALDPDDKEKTAFELARAWIIGKAWDHWPAETAASARVEDGQAQRLYERLVGRAPEAELRLIGDGNWASSTAVEQWQDVSIGVYRSPPADANRVNRSEQAMRLGSRAEYAAVLTAACAVPHLREIDGPGDGFCARLMRLLEPGTAKRFSEGAALRTSWPKWVKEQTVGSFYRAARLNLDYQDEQRLREHLGEVPKPSAKPDFLFGLSIPNGPRKATTVPIADETWRRADLFVAQLRCALRTGIDATQHVELPDGTLLIPLLEGVDAVVELSTSDGQDPSVVVELAVEDDCTEIVWSTRPDAPSRGLPEGVVLTGDGVSARVTFVPGLVNPNREILDALERLIEKAEEIRTTHY